MSRIVSSGGSVDRPLKLKFPDFASLVEEQYDLMENMGYGLYWEQVFRGQDCLDHSSVLLRFVKFGKGFTPNQSRLNTEISVMKNLEHNHIVGIRETFVSKDLLCFVSEYNSFNLSTLIGSKNAKSELDQPAAKLYLYQILQALSFCHSEGIIHFDLKPQNVYIDAEVNTVKLANFSLGRIVDLLNPGTVTFENKSALAYTAPEMVLSDPPYSFAVDMWALGCIFVEMSTKRLLFDVDVPSALTFAIINIFGLPNEQDWPWNTSFADFLKIWKIKEVPDFGHTTGLAICAPSLDQQGLDLLSRMLSFNPENRITANDALLHPYFNGVNS